MAWKSSINIKKANHAKWAPIVHDRLPMTGLPSFLAQEFPQLSDLHFFDYRIRSPIPAVITNRIRSFGQKLFPSPHSSEEQSDFDRALTLLRKNITELFNVSLISYDVALFGTPESALDEVFEGFPWARGSHYIIDKSFKTSTASAVLFAEKAGAVWATDESSSSAHSLLCVSYSTENVEKALKFQRRACGSHHVLLDATQAAPYEFVDLSRTVFDFVVLSMVKICGIELCPILLRREAAQLLAPFFYGGGAVAFSCARVFVHRPFRAHSKRFENGTPPQLAIFCALDGLNLMIEFRKKFAVGERVDEVIGRFVAAIEGRFEYEINKIEKTVFLKVEDAAGLQQQLIRKRVIVGVESGMLAVSFGFPTKDGDVDALIEALQS
jgi:selenocysteine lyase/cysteine desulfurase